MVSPGGRVPGRGCRLRSRRRRVAGGDHEIRQEEPVSRILSCAVIPLGAASPRTLISDLPGGFGTCIEAPQRRRPVAGDPIEPPGRAGPVRNAAWLWRTLPSLFGLAPCGVYPAPAFTGRAVRSCRTISPLPRRWSPARRTNPASGSRVALLRRGSRGGIFSVALAVHGF